MSLSSVKPKHLETNSSVYDEARSQVKSKGTNPVLLNETCQSKISLEDSEQENIFRKSQISFQPYKQSMAKANKLLKSVNISPNLEKNELLLDKIRVSNQKLNARKYNQKQQAN